MAKRVDRETPVQIAIVEYLRRVLPPDTIVHHARGEINRGGASFMRELAKAKRKGALPGFPDLVVLTHQGTLFFEVKAEGNYADKNQKAMHESMTALGYRVAVVRSIDDVAECLAEWGIGTRVVDVPLRGQIT